MTAQQALVCEAAHCRRRCAATHQKPVRRVQLVLPAFDPADFVGFPIRQIEAGLTVPATTETSDGDAA